jgi:hypothetical protein
MMCVPSMAFSSPFLMRSVDDALFARDVHGVKTTDAKSGIDNALFVRDMHGVRTDRCKKRYG